MLIQNLGVFSAYAEVFLFKIVSSALSNSFLRVRGGVSYMKQHNVPDLAFSPRTRRCFRQVVQAVLHLRVFSAYAEVFLPHRMRQGNPGRFLRVRGGVSDSALKSWPIC